MSIHQFQVVFVAEEDRLLLKLSTVDGMQFHSWITRRFIRLVWPNLTKAIENNMPNTDGTATTTNLLANFQLKQAEKTTDRSQEFGVPAGVTPQFPLGEIPFTAVKAAIAPMGKETVKFTLLPLSGKGFDVMLNHGILLTLMTLIVDAIKLTDWDITLTMPGAQPVHDTPKPSLFN